MAILTDEQAKAIVLLESQGLLTEEDKVKLREKFSSPEPIPQPTPTEREPGFIREGLQTAADAAQGVITPVENFGRQIPLAAARVTGNIDAEKEIKSRMAQSQQDLEVARERSPIATAAGESIVDTVPTALLGIGLTAAAATKVAQGVARATKIVNETASKSEKVKKVADVYRKLPNSAKKKLKRGAFFKIVGAPL